MPKPNNALFDFLAPFYDHVINPKENDILKAPLDLPADGWLLDAGGGTGRSSAQLQDAVDHLVICDISLKMLVMAREKGVENLVVASAKHLPFAPDSFERIMVIDALHHMEAQTETLGEIILRLKPGGRLLVEEPDIRLFAVKLIALFEKLALMKSHFHTPAEIIEMAESHGATARLDSDGKGSAWVIIEK